MAETLSFTPEAIRTPDLLLRRLLVKRLKASQFVSHTVNWIHESCR